MVILIIFGSNKKTSINFNRLHHESRCPLRRRHLQPPPSPKPAHRGFTGHPKAALTAGRSFKPLRVCVGLGWTLVEVGRSKFLLLHGSGLCWIQRLSCHFICHQKLFSNIKLKKETHPCGKQSSDKCLIFFTHKDMSVSKNRGTPKWMVYKGKPYKNGWFGGKKPYFWKHPHAMQRSSENRSRGSGILRRIVGKSPDPRRKSHFGTPGLAVCFFSFWITGGKGCDTLPENNIVSPWKMMVGRLGLPFGARPIFSGELLVYRSLRFGRELFNSKNGKIILFWLKLWGFGCFKTSNGFSRMALCIQRCFLLNLMMPKFPTSLSKQRFFCFFDFDYPPWN